MTFRLRPIERRKTRAFTIIEVLVVTGIIGLLIGMLFPALSAARGSARRVKELATVRQLVIGYTTYSASFNDAVMPGYKTQGLRATDRQGRLVEGFSDLATARYPWRLMPYLNFEMRDLFDSDFIAEMEIEEASDDPRCFHYLASLKPRYGLNSIWIGGDEGHLAFNPLYSRVYGRFYMTRLTEAQRPERLLVFAASRGPRYDCNGEQGDVTEGNFRVESRFVAEINGDRWATEYNDRLAPADWGFLSARSKNRTATAFVDGHVDTLSPNELRDMRYWANRATDADWGLRPLDAGAGLVTPMLRSLARRLPWLALGALHVAVLFGAVRTGVEHGWHVERLSSAFILLLVIAFFALKTYDVAWLRFSCSRRGFVAFCVATAIVHHDAVPASPQAPAVVLSVAAVGASLFEVSRRRATGSLLNRLLTRLAALFAPTVVAAIATDRVRDHVLRSFPIDVHCAAAPRGPPSR